MGPTWNQCGSAGPSRRSRGLLNLLFEDEDALPLLWRQHGDLFWGQLQDLHDESSLEDKNRRGTDITSDFGVNLLFLLRCGSLVSCVTFTHFVAQKENKRNQFKRLCCHHQLLFLKQVFSLRCGYLKADATQDDLQLVMENRNEERLRL